LFRVLVNHVYFVIRIHHIWFTYRVCLVCKTTSIVRNNTRKNSTIQGRTTQDKFLWQLIIFCFIRFLGDEML